MDWIKPGMVAKCDLLNEFKKRTGKTVLVRVLRVERNDAGDIISCAVQTLNTARRAASVLPCYLHALPLVPPAAPKPARPPKTTKRERKSSKA